MHHVVILVKLVNSRFTEKIALYYLLLMMQTAAIGILIIVS